MTLPDSTEPTESDPNAGDPASQPYERLRKERGAYRSYIHLNPFVAAIERRGEATPGELAQEFGWARSSLSYTFKRLIEKGQIVRIGAGRSIRYRVTTREEKETWLQDRYAKHRQKESLQTAETAPPAINPGEPAPVEKPKDSGLLPGGLRNLFKNLFTGR
jgi:hypothetical protein